MIKVGSDFSGVGAFNQALNRLKIEYKEVFACDMDKYARQTFIHNYGEPSYYPENVYDREIPNESLDIYMTSPPCQAFSLAGKRGGESDKKGILFYNSHEFIKKNNPRYFIFENVKGLLSDAGGNTFNKWVHYLGGKSVNGLPTLFKYDEAVNYHLYWKVLNAKDHGIPQNRERVFLIGIRDDDDNNFSFPKEEFLEKRLRDVLEDNVDEKYYLSEKMLEDITFNGKKNGEIANLNKGVERGSVYSDNSDCMTCLSATDFKQPKQIAISSGTSKGFEIAQIGEDSINLERPNSETRRGRVGDKVAQTLTTSCNQGVAIGDIRGCNHDNPKSRISGQETTQIIEINQNGTSNCLTTVQKNNVVVIGNLPGKHEQNSRVYGTNGVSPTLTTMQGGGQEPKIRPDYRIRKLTPKECFRLMDFPDSFSWTVSDSQAYKQAGNSICVGVLAKLISKLKF